MTVAPGTTGAAGAVDVDFRRFREGVVDHAGKILDVDAPSRDIGRYQETDASRAHALHDLLTFGLRKIRRDGLGDHALLAKELGDPTVSSRVLQKMTARSGSSKDRTRRSSASR